MLFYRITLVLFGVAFCFQSLMAGPTDSIGQFPSFQDVVSDYVNSWTYTFPETYVDRSQEFELDLSDSGEPMLNQITAQSKSDEARAKIKEALAKFPLPRIESQTPLQRKVFLRAYDFNANEFIRFRNAYRQTVQKIERAQNTPVKAGEMEQLFRNLDYQFDLSSMYHSRLAIWLTNLGSNTIPNVGNEKLLAMDVFFDFATKARELRISEVKKGSEWYADDIDQDLLKYSYVILMNDRTKVDATRLQELPRVLNYAYAILAAIKSTTSPTDRASIEKAQTRIQLLRNIFTAYWKAYQEPEKMSASIAAFEALRAKSCSWYLE